MNPVPDTTPLTAWSASTGQRRIAANTFSVTYSDNVSVKEATLGNGNVLVTGPNGFSELAALSGLEHDVQCAVDHRRLHPHRTGGAWTSSADGIYTVTMEANSVTDTAGNPVAAETLGTFTRSTSPSPSIPSKGHHTLRWDAGEATGRCDVRILRAGGPVDGDLCSFPPGQPGITLELLDANFNTIAGKKR